MSTDGSPFQWQAQAGRRALLQRIRGRFGAHLGRLLDPEDVLQESLLTALRATRGCWRDSRRALGAFLQRIADLRLKHEGRRAALRGTQTLVDEPLGRDQPTKRRLSQGLLELAPRLRGDHCWSLFLREWMSSPWDISAFVLDRPTTWAARSLHRRARVEIGDHERLC